MVGIEIYIKVKRALKAVALEWMWWNPSKVGEEQCLKSTKISSVEWGRRHCNLLCYTHITERGWGCVQYSYTKMKIQKNTEEGPGAKIIGLCNLHTL